ncbi:MAG: hypothetical protein JWM28_4539 [Chitinophagaceae bacterium]|nr:hypothetical protein [Chitinophagaceae bacterium]
MFPEHIKSIRTLLEAFPTEQSCIEFLEYRRWNGNVKSPFVQNGIAYKIKNGKYMCKKTRKYFTVRTGTIFEKTKVPLRDWFVAIWHLTSYKKGISSIQLSKELGITIKSAWLLAHKIRRFFAMEFEQAEAGIYELDELQTGGLQKNRHADKKFKDARGRLTPDKTWVLGFIQRDGLFRAFAVPDREAVYLHPIIRKYIKPSSVLISDGWRGYRGLTDDYHHHVVKDGRKAYAYNPEVHTNTIEGAWGIIMRGFNGIYNWWSKKHLQFYLDEFVYRYNTRKQKDIQRFCLFLDKTFKKITHKEIIATTWNY